MQVECQLLLKLIDWLNVNRFLNRYEATAIKKPLVKYEILN